MWLRFRGLQCTGCSDQRLLIKHVWAIKSLSSAQQVKSVTLFSKLFAVWAKFVSELNSSVITDFAVSYLRKLEDC